ncbi:hypothetical protein DUI87_23936 [Hirundo rustica rustica]|uniref:Uncharacterized protein n=1 Tax=Hirundo rustica rustica TaxID=333673 RepID=A0A3M0JFA6_HIRRU|nr:hypothetical protein DUI87_23936 [Hirundo rustica rustica]
MDVPLRADTKNLELTGQKDIGQNPQDKGETNKDNSATVLNQLQNPSSRLSINHQSSITGAPCDRRRTGYLTAIDDTPGTDHDRERTVLGPTIACTLRRDSHLENKWLLKKVDQDSHKLPTRQQFQSPFVTG